jgi:hypothetical protein
MVSRIAFRLDPASRTMTVTAEVDSESKHGWVTADAWTCPAPSSADGPALEETMRRESDAHGWSLAGEPTTVDGAVLVPAEPADWHSVLAAATRHRADRLADFNAADLAWQALVARAPRRGADGYVGAIEIAAMAGFTRHRIYQIQGVGKTAGTFPPDEKKNK